MLTKIRLPKRIAIQLMKNTCLECNSKEQLWIYEKAEGNKLEYVTLCWRCGKKARLDPNDNGKYKWVYYPDQKK